MPNLKARLWIMFFLQFFIWGSWYVTLGTYLLKTLEFSGREVGLVYGSTAIAATITPFFLGVIADRFFAAEKLLSLLHLAGGLVLILASQMTSFLWFYPTLILYTLLYMPTFALSTALSFHHLKDISRDFPMVRVGGTLGWIFAGLTISFLNLEALATPLQISAVASFVLGIYCLRLPHTPPQANQGKMNFSKLMGGEIFTIFASTSFVVLIGCLILIRVPESFYYTFVNPFLNEWGMTNAAAKMTLGQMSEVLIMLVLPWLFIRLRIKWIMAIGLFLWGFRYVLFAFGMHPGWSWMLYIGILMHGITFNFTTLSAQIYIDRHVPARLKSTAQGFVTQVTNGIGALFGTYIAGEVVTQFTLPDGSHQWTEIWLIPAAMGMSIALIFILFFWPKKKEAAGTSPTTIP
ncbi:MAG: nucleoside permease [Saprospiraceae bacterium]|nr:MAG: nucleoside permease [Saprospiraceae bacterium]